MADAHVSGRCVILAVEYNLMASRRENVAAVLQSRDAEQEKGMVVVAASTSRYNVSNGHASATTLR